MKKLLFNLNLLVGIVILSSVYESNGMFETILTQLDVTDNDNSYANFNNIKVVRFNRTTFVINGTFELFVDSVDDFDVICNVFKKAGNEYKLTPYKVGPIKICDALKKDELFYPSIHASTENFPPLGTCDFTKGNVYKVINYLPNLDKVPPVFQSGDYMTECKGYKGEEFVLGLKVYGQIYNIASGGALKG